MEDQLFHEDKKNIELGRELEETHMFLFQSIMKKLTSFKPQRPAMYLNTDAIRPVPVDEDYLQILHCRNPSQIDSGDPVHHWVCLYYDTKNVYIYDSLNKCIVPDDLKICLKHLFPHISSSDVKFPKVQQQTGNDCGIYAIAFAVSLLFGIKPHLVRYEVKSMRNHLIEMLEKCDILHFPQNPNLPQKQVTTLAYARYKRMYALQFSKTRQFKAKYDAKLKTSLRKTYVPILPAPPKKFDFIDRLKPAKNPTMLREISHIGNFANQTQCSNNVSEIKVNFESIQKFHSLQETSLSKNVLYLGFSNAVKEEREVDDDSNSIYDEEFSNNSPDDEQLVQNKEHFSSNNFEEPVDIKENIKVEETTFLDGTNYLNYENFTNKLKTETQYELSTFENCDAFKEERQAQVNEDSNNINDGTFSNDSPDGEQLIQNENSDEMDKTECKPNIKEATSKYGLRKRVECEFCDATSTCSNMKEHVYVTHFGLKNHECKYCDYASSYPSVLRNHLDAVHYKLKKYKCKYCDYAASYPSSLKHHIGAVHDKLKNYKCEYCDYSASRSSTLKYHITVAHLKLKNHKCQYCDYAAMTPSTIKSHIRAVHQKFKDHKCEYCNYTASQPGNLKRHVNEVHKKIKNHKCAYCDYTASQLAVIKHHTNVIHHKIKNYKCEYCDFTTTTPSILKHHILSLHHKLKDYKCKYCDYTANLPTVLRNHINGVHRKLKNHKCQHCDYAATTSSIIKSHIRAVHQKFKDHKCEYCNYTASQSWNLKRHIKNVHKKNQESQIPIKKISKMLKKRLSGNPEPKQFVDEIVE